MQWNCSFWNSFQNERYQQPFKRPDTIVLIPLAPARIVRWIACFCARRKAIRRSKSRAIPSATNLASKSGF